VEGLGEEASEEEEARRAGCRAEASEGEDSEEEAGSPAVVTAVEATEEEDSEEEAGSPAAAVVGPPLVDRTESVAYYARRAG
jgi:hypothetical protein